MEYFKHLQNVDVVPFLEEIEQNEDAWLENTSRQEKVSAQKETQTIVLRNAVTRDDISINENQECAWTHLAKRFPVATKFMEEVAHSMDATLSRATIVRLQPKGNVYLHTDHGSYYFIRKRLHLVLQSLKGSMLMSGGEKVLMREGELWWFDNKQHHQAINNSDDWRIHFIFDILPNENARLAKNPLKFEKVAEHLAKAEPFHTSSVPIKVDD
ncbi:MAG: aspartyl/asparaginyl beta-hydroxylase domain-containing protein [Alphaproteobacteria bacterium]|nr:aspartyl/asparaginyl beta-hydroxylase domain-containing protein [Alphaproteobacteria bacterium]